MPEATLAAVRSTFTLFYEALAGRPVTLVERENEHDVRDTRTTIRLPDHLHDEPAPRAWYRLAVAHRALHEQAGTFGFRWGRAAAHFARGLPPREALARYPGESDLDAFLRLFAERTLAVEVFTLLEDLRIEAILERSLPGLAGDLGRIRAAELALRPPLAGLLPRAALLEVLALLSLGAHGATAVPAPLAGPARDLAVVAGVLARPGATVEDAVEATLRAYVLISRVPALGGGGETVVVDLGASGAALADLPLAFPETARPSMEGDDIFIAAVAPIGYRDVLGWRHAGHPTPTPVDQEAIYRLSPGSDEGEETPAGAAATARGDEETTAPSAGPLPHPPHDLPDDAPRVADGELARTAPEEFIYPEWDHVRREQRARWCRVRESRAPAGPSTRFFRETLRTYAALVPELRRGLERLAPRGLRRVRGLREGDELDLDAAIEAFTDLRAGVEPGDRLFSAMERERRDIATLFLFDVSASTADRVEGPGLAGRPPSGRTYHRIIDVEREAIVLLMAALDTVGDAFGVHAFSGSGRDDVRIVVLKDLAERLSDRVMSRLEAVRPIHTTRMGAAIRHATARLRRYEARTRLLVLISDGRPFDLDYGQAYGEGAEVVYAIEDTHAALEEARLGGVEPYVLTVDPAGAGYLREIIADVGPAVAYEVLADTASLPLRLLALYRRLAA